MQARVRFGSRQAAAVRLVNQSPRDRIDLIQSTSQHRIAGARATRLDECSQSPAGRNTVHWWRTAEQKIVPLSFSRTVVTDMPRPNTFAAPLPSTNLEALDAVRDLL